MAGERAPTLPSLRDRAQRKRQKNPTTTSCTSFVLVNTQRSALVNKSLATVDGAVLCVTSNFSPMPRFRCHQLASDHITLVVLQPLRMYVGTTAHQHSSRAVVLVHPTQLSESTYVDLRGIQGPTALRAVHDFVRQQVCSPLLDALQLGLAPFRSGHSSAIIAMISCVAFYRKSPRPDTRSPM